MWDTLADMLQDPNMRWILAGCSLLGLSSGLIGCFSFLRKQSLIGDTLAHAALPGICIAFMLTGVKTLPVLLIGAALAGTAATFGIGWITRHTRIKQDAAMGIVLSSFFALGTVLLTFIQHGDYGNQAGLDKFIFGQAASMTGGDVKVMTGVSFFLIGVIVFLFKPFKLVILDPGFARGIGYPVAFLQQLLLLLTVLAVVTGVQAVGVVLVAAMLITPAVSARYWTDRLDVMVALSGVFGLASGAAGTLISASVANIPTGPLTVLSAALLFGCSMLFGTQRGLLAKAARKRRAKHKLVAQAVVHSAERMQGGGRP